MKKKLQHRKQHFHLSTVSYFHSGLQYKRITHHSKDVLSLWSTQSLIFTRTTNKGVDTALTWIFPIQICWQATGMTSHCVQLLHSSSAKMIQQQLGSIEFWSTSQQVTHSHVNKSPETCHRSNTRRNTCCWVFAMHVQIFLLSRVIVLQLGRC